MISQNVALSMSMLAIASVMGAGVAIGSGIGLLASSLTEEEVRAFWPSL